MMTLTPYVRSVEKRLRQWAFDPQVGRCLRAGGYFMLGLVSAGGALTGRFLPLGLCLCCAFTGWGSLLVGMGSCVGYLWLWGGAAWQAVAWVLTGCTVAVLFADRRTVRQTPLLLPAAAALTVAVWGVIFQSFYADKTPVSVYLLRAVLALGASWVLGRVVKGREPVCEWLSWGLAALCLAQLAVVPWLNPGYILCAGLCVAGAFPAAALAGLGLDLSGITCVPVTAVMCAGYLVRFLPRKPRLAAGLAPAVAGFLVMQTGCGWDLTLLPGLALGGMVGSVLPLPGRLPYRRGETGVAQVRLEMAAGVLSQTEQLLAEAPPPPVDEDALVRRAAESACAGCPCRHNCKDSRRIAQLPGPVLHKSLISPEEIPVQCRRTGRFLAQLHRSQEQLRTIRADRERQQEYKAAVIQQYRFLAAFLRELSDQLPRRAGRQRLDFQPWVQFYGNRPAEDNADRCLSFPGVGGRHYVILCDGMGTGPGAVQEGMTAADVLKRLLSAGYPAQYALRSLNSLCALRQRAGAVTVDLVELQLDTGKVCLYKWGAPPAWLVSAAAVQRLGQAGPPPGISVTEYRESVESFSMRRGELLVLASDGVDCQQAQACCRAMMGSSAPGELVRAMMACGQTESSDDATMVLIRLDPA